VRMSEDVHCGCPTGCPIGCPFALARWGSPNIPIWGVAGELIDLRAGESVGELLS